jgi:hypothetical protein
MEVVAVRLSRGLACTRSLAVAALLVAALAIGLARAGTPYLGLGYALHLGGVQVASVDLRIDEADGVYQSEMRLRTRGLLDTVVRYRGSMSASTANGVEGGFRPLRYEAAYSTRRYDRDVELTYDAASGEIVHLVNHKRGEAQDSRFEPEVYADTIDPLSALLALREGLRQALAGGPAIFVAQVFDGRRRYDLSATYRGTDRARIDRRDQDVLRVEIRMRAIAGFNDRDLLAGWTDDGNRMIDILVSADERLLPLRIETRGGTLSSTAVLTSSCTGDGC